MVPHSWYEIISRVLSTTGRATTSETRRALRHQTILPQSAELLEKRLLLSAVASDPEELNTTLDATNVVANAASIVRTGAFVDVYGTGVNDTFRFVAGSTMTVGVNSISQTFALVDVDYIRYHGGGGTDTINIKGSAGDEVAVLRAGSARFSGTGYRVTTDNIEKANVNAAGGNDNATFYDTAGNDRFFAKATFARMLGTGFNNYATGFERVTANATAGGTDDRATLYDSLGNDIFTAKPTFERLRGTGFDN